MVLPSRKLAAGRRLPAVAGPSRPGRVALFAALLAQVPACGDDGGGDGGSSGSSGSSGSGTFGTFGTFGTGGGETEGGDTDGAGPVQASNRCEFAPEVGQGRWMGTLRGRAEEELGGACGLGGPDAFLRVAVPWRADVRVQAVGAGFEPRVGLLRGACLPRWDTHMDACVQGVAGWALDVRPDEPLVVSIGADADDPALAPTDGPEDPAAFAVDVALRRVLSAGEPCDPAGPGRCEGGTACLGEPSTCQILEADTCLTAEAVDVLGAVVTRWVDPATPQSDAHAHSCGGARWRERVLRLTLPAELPPSDLSVTVGPDVALAARGPGCLLAQELACAPAKATGAALLVPDVHLRGDAGEPIYLFVEMSPGVDPNSGPFAVELAVVPG